MADLHRTICQKIRHNQMWYAPPRYIEEITEPEERTTLWQWGVWEETSWDQKDNGWQTGQQTEKTYSATAEWKKQGGGTAEESQTQRGQIRDWGNLDKSLTASTLIYVMQAQKSEKEGQGTYWMNVNQVANLLDIVVALERWSTVGSYTKEMMVTMGHTQKGATGKRLFQIRALQKEAGGKATSSSASQEPTE